MGLICQISTAGTIGFNTVMAGATQSVNKLGSKPQLPYLKQQPPSWHIISVGDERQGRRRGGGGGGATIGGAGSEEL